MEEDRNCRFQIPYEIDKPVSIFIIFVFVSFIWAYFLVEKAIKIYQDTMQYPSYSQ